MRYYRNKRSGKFTLLKAVSGILKPYKGNVKVNGSIAPLIELGAGFDLSLIARKNIYLNGCVLGRMDKYMREHFDGIVDFAELWEFLDSPVKNHSSGMKVGFGFAVATMTQPDILIVDEILSIGDYVFRKKCEERINEMIPSGTTLLYVLHSLDEVKRLCNHTIWLDKGSTRMLGGTQEVCDATLRNRKGNGRGEIGCTWIT